MKILKSSHINPFGGLNFVLEEFDRLKLGGLLEQNLPELPSQSKYCWKDILYSFWSVYFCGGDCIEDLGGNFHHHLVGVPFLKVPSPDRVLDRFKELALPKKVVKSPRGKSLHQLGINLKMNSLNLRILTSLGALSGKDLVLDYDNTIIFNNKSDSVHTYKKESGYHPGVGIIGNHVVYVENRNGNSSPRTLQDKTVGRMFDLLAGHGVKIKAFRADSGSYLYEVVRMADKRAENLYIKARMTAPLANAIKDVQDWTRVKGSSEVIYRGEIDYTPFMRAHKDSKRTEPLARYRLVISKIERKDKQMNLFTNEACIYSAILTNDYQMSIDAVVDFYNQRGTAEKEFDVMKNDFGWDNLPFSKLEQNTVFMIATAMCRNLYHHIIERFSKRFERLKPNFRIKKFIFRFIAVPAKWIRTSREYKLRIYGDLHFRT